MFSPALTGDQNVSDASVTNALLVYTKGDGTLAVGIDGYAAGTVYTDTALSANTEYHVTVTVSDDGTGNAGGGSAAGITIKMWVDGTAQALLDPNDASTVTGHPLGWVGVAAPNDGSVPIGVVTVGAYPDGNYGWEGSISGVTVDTGTGVFTHATPLVPPLQPHTCASMLQSVSHTCDFDFGPAGGYAGLCNLECGFNTGDILNAGSMWCSQMIQEGHTCANDFGSGGDYAGACDFECGYCSASVDCPSGTFSVVVSGSIDLNATDASWSLDSWYYNHSYASLDSAWSSDTSASAEFAENFCLTEGYHNIVWAGSAECLPNTCGMLQVASQDDPSIVYLGPDEVLGFGSSTLFWVGPPSITQCTDLSLDANMVCEQDFTEAQCMAIACCVFEQGQCMSWAALNQSCADQLDMPTCILGCVQQCGGSLVAQGLDAVAGSDGQLTPTMCSCVSTCDTSSCDTDTVAGIQLFAANNCTATDSDAMVPAPAPGTDTCVDTDFGATDSDGYGCAFMMYDSCGSTDDDDFTAATLCCICGGGTADSWMLTGEQVCEDQGFTQPECEAVGCCNFENGVCHSAVGDALCTNVDFATTETVLPNCTYFQSHPDECGPVFGAGYYSETSLCCACGGGYEPEATCNGFVIATPAGAYLTPCSGTECGTAAVQQPGQPLGSTLHFECNNTLGYEGQVNYLCEQSGIFTYFTTSNHLCAILGSGSGPSVGTWDGSGLMLTGEQACEDQGFTQLECEAVGCCHFENEVCHSAVGDALCSDSSEPEPISCAFENISVSEISSGGDPSDFIELYNSGDVNCSIGGFRLIGDNGTGVEFIFPDSEYIGPGDFLVGYSEFSDAEWAGGGHVCSNWTHNGTGGASVACRGVDPGELVVLCSPPLPGCSGQDPTQGVTSCSDCPGLAFVPSLGICTGCMSDGITEITPSNAGILAPLAEMCTALTGEAACENHGFNETECNSVGCCHYSEEGSCMSSVGSGMCASGPAAPSCRTYGPIVFPESLGPLAAPNQCFNIGVLPEWDPELHQFSIPGCVCNPPTPYVVNSNCSTFATCIAPVANQSGYSYDMNGPLNCSQMTTVNVSCEAQPSCAVGYHGNPTDADHSCDGPGYELTLGGCSPCPSTLQQEYGATALVGIEDAPGPQGEFCVCPFGQGWLQCLAGMECWTC